MNTAAELRRLRYLQAMDIDVHVARRPLPGARQLPRLGLRPAPAGAPAAATGAAAIPAQRGAASAAARRAARDLADAPAGAAASRAPAPSPRRARTPGERFSVAAVVSGGRLWIEELGSDALAREQVQLMVAIGRALDHPTPAADTAQVSQFDWPLSNNPQLDLGADEALAALHSFLHRQLGDLECTSVMCCGESAAARIADARLGVPVQRLPATRHLLAAPQEKRELWRTLRP